MNLADACRVELDADTATAQAALDRAIATGVPPRTPNPDGTPSSYDLAFEPEHILAVLGSMRRILDEVVPAIVALECVTDEGALARDCNQVSGLLLQILTAPYIDTTAAGDGDTAGDAR